MKVSKDGKFFKLKIESVNHFKTKVTTILAYLLPISLMLKIPTFILLKINSLKKQ